MGNEQRQLPLRQPLIPGLPDDVAMDCLVRIPYHFHSGLRSVCRNWRDLTASPSFYHQRLIAGAAESLVCLIQAVAPKEEEEAQGGGDGDDGKEGKTNTAARQSNKQQTSWAPPTYGLTLYNATLGTWHRLSGASVPLFAKCVAVPSAGKLVLLGGWDPSSLDSVRDVFVVDMVTGRRQAGRPMSIARSFFACAAVGGLVYVAGGHDNQKNALRTAEAYDPVADAWRPLPAMADERDECQGLAMGEKFWVVSGYGTDNQGQFGRSAECFDPATGGWEKVEGLWGDEEAPSVDSPRFACFVLPTKSSSNTETTSFMEERLWHFDCSEGRRGIREYDDKDKRWRPAGDLPEPLKSSPSVAVIGGNCADGREVFVMGTDGEQRHRAWVMDAGSKKWAEVDAPTRFSMFAYSATSLRL